ncbi:MAG: hypothetical protein ACJ8H8_32900 [Geminicoccaceae bacterium]
MLAFKIVGSWVRGLYLMGLGSFWMFMTFYLSGMGRTAPSTTTFVLGGFGALLFGVGLIFVFRGVLLTTQRAPVRENSGGWRDTGEKSESDSGFDPDAAIARYLERRPETPAPVLQPPAAPPRPAFGRKQA